MEPNGKLSTPPHPTPHQTSTKHSKSEMFELIDRLQSSRLDDQRCVLPATLQPTGPTGGVDPVMASKNSSKNLLRKTLQEPTPHPMVVLPAVGGWWVDPWPRELSRAVSAPSGYKEMSRARSRRLELTCDLESSFEAEQTARSYRTHFLGYEHYNFCAVDENLGPVVLSLKTYSEAEKEDAEESENTPLNHTRVVVRLSSGTSHKLVPDSSIEEGFSPVKMAQYVTPELVIDKLSPVLCPKASELIVNYDEHVLVNSYKFGLVYQRRGQCAEEDMFGNQGHSAAMEEFMGMLGQKIALSEHRGYRGGLDTQYGQTGEQSLYETFRGKEIMFHVSTLLPYTESEPQQLQRKRHIGNDIVAIIFQDPDTPFTPDMITSNFLHAFIVVQPIDPCTENTRYRISVTARSDVPFFGPALPNSSVLKKGAEAKEFLLTKLINAESACYKAERFSTLQKRTRQTLLSNLVTELHRQTEIYTSPLPYKLKSEAFGSANGATLSSSSSGFISSMKKALMANRSKSQGPPEGRFMKITSSSSSSSTSTSSRSHRLLSSTLPGSDYDLSSTTPQLVSSSTFTSSASSSMRRQSRQKAKNNGSSGDSGHGESSDNSICSSSPVAGDDPKRPELVTSSVDDSAENSSTSSMDSSSFAGSLFARQVGRHHRHHRDRDYERHPFIQPRPLTPPPVAPTPPPLPPSFCASAAVGGDIFINGNGRPRHNHKHDDVIPQRGRGGGGGRCATKAESPPAAAMASAAAAAAADDAASSDMGRTAVISLHAPPSITTTKSYRIDPNCQNVVSGSVTMITVEGDAVASQLDKLQDEIGKLRLEKLELLRQNVSCQHEVQRLRDREMQLQADLNTASREINRLRDGFVTSIMAAKSRQRKVPEIASEVMISNRGRPSPHIKRRS